MQNYYNNDIDCTLPKPLRPTKQQRLLLFARKARRESKKKGRLILLPTALNKRTLAGWAVVSRRVVRLNERASLIPA